MSDFVPGLEGVVAFETEIAEPTGRAARCATAASTSRTSSAGCRTARCGASSWTASSTRACHPPSRSRSPSTPATSESTSRLRSPCWRRRGVCKPLLDIDDDTARENLAHGCGDGPVVRGAVGPRARGLPMVPQTPRSTRPADRGRAVHDPLARRAGSQARQGRRRLLDVRRRARHERVDVHRPRHRIDRRGRGGGALRRGRRDVGSAARRRPVPGPRHDRGDRADAATPRPTSRARSTRASG